MLKSEFSNIDRVLKTSNFEMDRYPYLKFSILSVFVFLCLGNFTQVQAKQTQFAESAIEMEEPIEFVERRAQWVHGWDDCRSRHNMARCGWQRTVCWLDWQCRIAQGVGPSFICSKQTAQNILNNPLYRNEEEIGRALLNSCFNADVPIKRVYRRSEQRFIKK